MSEPTLGRDYGRLSEVAHPTKSAAFNSVTKLSRLGFARSLRVNFSFFKTSVDPNHNFSVSHQLLAAEKKLGDLDAF